jgi:hypothetical protein
MTKITYEVVEHDGGWAYRMNGAFSESFPSHSDALQAATIAATAQQRRDVSDRSIVADDGRADVDELDLEILDRSRGKRRINLSGYA